MLLGLLSSVPEVLLLNGMWTNILNAILTLSLGLRQQKACR